MKKLLIFATTIVLVSCSQIKKNEFVIAGTTPKEIADGTAVYLQKQDSLGQFVALDTAKVKGSKFEFKNKFDDKKIEQGIAVLAVDKIEGKVQIILESGKIIVEIRKDSITKSKVGGTASNKQLSAYTNESSKIYKQMMVFQNANLPKLEAAKAANDTITINALMKENNVFMKSVETLGEKSLEKNPSTLLSLYLLQNATQNPAADRTKLKKSFQALATDVKTTKIGKKLGKDLGVTSK
jgi:hypothetical protein